MEQRQQRGSGMVVAFTAPWCGFCKKFVPEFKAAEKIFEGLGGGAKWVEVRADVNTQDIEKKYGVKIDGFPTAYVWRKHGEKKQLPSTPDAKLLAFRAKAFIEGHVKSKPSGASSSG